MYRVAIDVGPEAFVVGRRRAQEEITAPKGAKVEVELALSINEQGAATFLLQNRQRVLGLQGEILDEVIEIPPIGLGAEVCPSLESTQGQLGEQIVDVLQHGAKAARRPRGKLMDKLEIAAQQFRITEPARGGGEAGEQKGDDIARSHRREFQCRIEAVADDVLAALLDDGRHLFEIADDDVAAAAEIAQSLGALEVFIEARGRHDSRGVVEGRLESRFQLRRCRIEAILVVVKVDAHRIPAPRCAVFLMSPL